jgi:hypothetical protein
LQGKLFVSQTGTGSEVWLVDPDTHAQSVFISAEVDGLVVDPTGTRLYIAQPSTSSVRGYDLTKTPPALVYQSGAITDGTNTPLNVDGLAMGVGSLQSFLFVNCNDGTLWMLNPTGAPLAAPTGIMVPAGAAVLIASEGTRGDFVAGDTLRCIDSRGVTGECMPSLLPTLLITQSAEIDRLTIAGGGFEAPPSSQLYGPDFQRVPGPDLPATGPFAFLALAAMLIGLGWAHAHRVRATAS